MPTVSTASVGMFEITHNVFEAFIWSTKITLLAKVAQISLEKKAQKP